MEAEAQLPPNTTHKRANIHSHTNPNSLAIWSEWRDSNPRPLVPQTEGTAVFLFPSLLNRLISKECSCLLVPSDVYCGCSGGHHVVTKGQIGPGQQDVTFIC